jgi:hypothetical protein
MCLYNNFSEKVKHKLPWPEDFFPAPRHPKVAFGGAA